MKLTKEQKATVETTTNALRDSYATLKAAVVEANEQIVKINEALDLAYGAYNEALATAVETRDQLVADLQSEFDEKSEKWQEGDKGQESQEAITAWEEIDLEDLTYTPLEEIDFEEECQHAIDLDNAVSP